MTLSIDSIRKDTDGCQTGLYFNSAQASLMPKPVVEAMQAHLALEVKYGGVIALQHNASRVQSVQASVAKFLNASTDEIALFDSATRAWDMAFYSHDFQPGDKVITSFAEYSSNYLAMLHLAKKKGIVIELIENDDSGQLSLQDLEVKLDDRVKLIALTHVPTSSGLVNPAAEVGKLAKAYQIPYLLDACQSAGQMPLDVEELQCDMLSAAGRKFLRGPRGTGFLYVRQSYLAALEPHYLESTGVVWEEVNQYRLLDTAKRFDKYEHNAMARVGLGAAVDYALEIGLDQIWSRIQYLADLLRTELSEIDGIQVLDPGQQRCGIVTFRIFDRISNDVQEELASENIYVSSNSRPHARLDLEDRNLTDYVRASVHYFNTESEVERFVDRMKRMVS